MQEEIWKPVTGYEGFYSVSSFGRIRQDAKRGGTSCGKILNFKKSSGRYYRTIFCVNGRRKAFNIHCLVAREFIGERPYKFVINHKDCDRYNNHVDNLEYVSTIDNIRHSHNNGIGAHGERIKLAKLTDKEVLKIREKYKKGINQSCRGNSYNILAKQFSVKKSCIANIIHRRTWKHI